MAELKQGLEQLTLIAGPDRLNTDLSVTAQYAVDGLVPKAVVFPKDTKMVGAVIQFACRANLAGVPWGSGTKMVMILKGHLGRRKPLKQRPLLALLHWQMPSIMRLERNLTVMC